MVDVVRGEVVDKVSLPSDGAREPHPEPPSDNILAPDSDGQLSFTGLEIAPDGKSLFLSNVNGSIKVFAIGETATGSKLTPSHSIELPGANAPRRLEEIPAGLAVSPDGERLYVCGNLSNRLLEIEIASGRVLRMFDVGVAPYDVALLGNKAYVSNWGGRRPQEGVLTGPAGRGTWVRVDPKTHVANEGSVSVIDLAAGRVTSEILTGLHACALAVSPDRRYVVVANAMSDTLSVIDTESDSIVETIWMKPKPSDPLGATPNALAFDRAGERLYVGNGTQNAVGVVEFAPEDGESKLLGLFPVGWFPGALTLDESGEQIFVANMKGVASDPRPIRKDGPPGLSVGRSQGSLSLIELPDEDDLPELSQRVFDYLRGDRIAEAFLPPRSDQPARAIPQRIGEPSLIEHVVYIIKENRTYDQVLGDDPRGNGDPRLTIFGKFVTPNQHRLVEEFVLLDNTYCAGILSADGHQWSTSAFGTDYLERSFAGWPRSYPDGMGIDENDALAYAPSGFLWDNAIAHGIPLRNYGEFMAPQVRYRDETKRGTPDFMTCWRTREGESDQAVFESEPMIESLRPYSPTETVGWEMAVPDQYRADFFLRELAEFEKSGDLPRLMIICLPNDHTSGASEGMPTPSACVADNDLALGRIVEGLSHSRFWPKLAVFVIEDDPQAGFDHVSGYRTTSYVASPYAKRGVVVSTHYNTTSILRTIEQILGLPPMNAFDAAALPMFDCFTDVADLRPFRAVPNNVPLTELNPKAHTIRDPQLRADALACARMNFAQMDRAPEDELNRVLWRAVRGSAEPYPDWAIDPLVKRGEDDGSSDDVTASDGADDDEGD